MTIISVCSSLALAEDQRDNLIALYPGIGELLIVESSTGFGFVVGSLMSRAEFQVITGLAISYDLSHLA
jgi:hypothetical protein